MNNINLKKKKNYIFDPAVENNLTNETSFIINVVSVLFQLPS